MLQNKVSTDVINDQSSNVLINAAKSTFQCNNVTNNNNGNNGKPWFDNECRKARKEYNRSQNRYKRFRT